MLTANILSFLEELKGNNNREWFESQKERYTALRTDFEHLTELFLGLVSEYDETVRGLEAKKAVFRIYRDVRFAKDKSPYKTNFGMFLVPGGRKCVKAGYYLHLEPGASFAGGGIYQPPTDALKTLREAIYHNYDEFESIVEGADFKSHFNVFSDDMLKKPPKGFDPQFAGIEWLKNKHIAVGRNFADSEVQNPDFVNAVGTSFEMIANFNAFINKALR